MIYALLRVARSSFLIQKPGDLKQEVSRFLEVSMSNVKVLPYKEFSMRTDLKQTKSMLNIEKFERFSSGPQPVILHAVVSSACFTIQSPPEFFGGYRGPRREGL